MGGSTWPRQAFDGPPASLARLDVDLCGDELVRLKLRLNLRPLVVVVVLACDRRDGHLDRASFQLAVPSKDRETHDLGRFYVDPEDAPRQTSQSQLAWARFRARVAPMPRRGSVTRAN